MKKIERAQTLKVSAGLETLKRLNLNSNPLVFYSEPSPANVTPITTSQQKSKLEPQSKNNFLIRKPTVKSLSIESTSTSTMKAIHFIASDSDKKFSQYVKAHIDSDSDANSIASSGLKYQRTSKFAQASSNESNTKQPGQDSNIMVITVLNSKKEFQTEPSPIKNNTKQMSSKASDSIMKLGDSSFMRKAFRVVKNPPFLDHIAENEVKKPQTHKEEPIVPYRGLYFSPIFNYEKYKKHLLTVHKGLVYSTKNLKSPSDKFLATKQVMLPDSSTKKSKTLILDLDETLIHTCTPKDNPDVILQGDDVSGDILKIPVKIRPYLRDFLNKVHPIYEIVIFTAASAPYANTIVNHIDPERKFINYMLTREHCMETKNGYFIKDLRIIKNRELKDMIIVDNLVHSFGFQLDNGVPILEFINDSSDMELRYLADYLLKGHYYSDLRDYNREKLRLVEMAERKFEEIESEIKFL